MSINRNVVIKYIWSQFGLTKYHCTHYTLRDSLKFYHLTTHHFNDFGSRFLIHITVEVFHRREQISLLNLTLKHVDAKMESNHYQSQSRPKELKCDYS